MGAWKKVTGKEVTANLAGKKVKLGITNGGIPPGVYRCEQSWNANGYYYFKFAENLHLYPNGIQLNITSLEYTNGISRDSLMEEHKELKAREAEIKESLSYLAEVGETEAEEDEMKAYLAMKAMDKDASLLDKAKVLAKLMKR